mmetsp:Transcript_10087/g.14062  ORF Transcript_10087/g.14062 Transcript_10087/m.14062 type:complete len:162 (+) Transcript_10087:108-593(+)
MDCNLFSFCDFAKSVVPNENVKSRSTTLLLLVVLQVLFGLCKISTGFPGVGQVFIGVIGYVGISNDAGYYINMIFFHALLSCFHVMMEVEQVLKVWMDRESKYAQYNRLSQRFHAQTACLYLVATYISAVLYLELTQCDERVIIQPSTAYSALSDNKDKGE